MKSKVATPKPLTDQTNREKILLEESLLRVMSCTSKNLHRQLHTLFTTKDAKATLQETITLQSSKTTSILTTTIKTWIYPLPNTKFEAAIATTTNEAQEVKTNLRDQVYEAVQHKVSYWMIMVVRILLRHTIER